MRLLKPASDADVVRCLAERRSLGGAGAVLSIGKLTVEQSRYYERQVAQGA